MAEPLLHVAGLRKTFPGADRPALDGVDLELTRGDVFGLAGPSGSGKSTLARILLRLIAPDAGTIRLDGADLLAGDGKFLPRKVQMVFQDPLAALNPRATIARVLDDPLRLHGFADRPARIAGLMAQTGLPADLLAKRPHELSGGQRQRVAIARALACGPELIVLDEPVSALDVSVRARIINLLLDLREATGVSYLLISHDLALLNAIATTVAIIAAGRIVEAGPPGLLFRHPGHDATRRLLDAVPRIR